MPGPDCVVTIGGSTRTTYVDVHTIDIIDDLNELPNTASFTCFGFTPSNDQAVVITSNSGSVKEFAGKITGISESHNKLTQRTEYQVTCTDSTRKFDAKLITKLYSAVSATTIGTDIVSIVGGGFTSTNIAAALAAITIAFKMTPAASALRQIADAIGGDTYIDYDDDVHLFVTETAVTPDTIQVSNRDWRQFQYKQAIERVVNRIFVEGDGTSVAGSRSSTIAVGATQIPVDDQAAFSASGGSAISGSQILTYTGKSADAGNGTNVAGIVKSPGSLSPAAANVGGNLAAGTYSYKQTCVNSNGDESEPGSASSSVTINAVSAPSALNAAQASGVAGNLTAATFGYKVAYKTATGETLVGSSGSGSISQVSAPSGSHSVSGTTGGGLTPSTTYLYDVTYVDAVGETTYGFEVSVNLTAGQNAASITSIPTSSDARVVARNIYRAGATRRLIATIPDNTTTSYTDTLPDASVTGKTYVSSNTTGTGKMSLTSIGTSGDGRVTARALYRTKAGGSTYYYLATIGDNSTTTYTDNGDDASLVTEAPSALTDQTTPDNDKVSLTSIATGPTGTVSRKVYRTLVGGSTYRYAFTLSDNSTTSYTDNIHDTSLGEEIPAVSTWRTVAGSTTLPLKSLSGLTETAGWVKVGSQLVKYTGQSGSSITGIPSSGVGSLAADVLFNHEVVAQPFLKGIPSSSTGSILYALNQGDPINLLVQRDDSTSQSTYGIREFHIVDRNLSITSAQVRGDAELTLRKDPYLSGSFIATDTKIRSGRRITISLSSEWGISGTFTISQVRIFWDPNRLAPQRQVTFTNHATEKDLYRLIREFQARQQAVTA